MHSQRPAARQVTARLKGGSALSVDAMRLVGLAQHII